MIEFLISLTALVPLFFAIAMLGKYLDIKSATIQGARYAAWERTVWNGDSNSGRSNQKDIAVLQSEIRERIFSAPGTVIKQDDGVARTALRADVNPVWNDYTGKPMLAQYTDTTATTAHKNQSGIIGGVSSLFLAVSEASKIGAMGTGDEFKLNHSGLYTVRVQANVAQPPKLLRGLSGNMTAWAEDTVTPLSFGAGTGATYGTSVLLADAWSASGPGWSKTAAHVKSQVTGLTPTSWPAVQLLFVPMLGDPARQRISADGALMEPGKIDTDVIPPDRLQ